MAGNPISTKDSSYVASPTYPVSTTIVSLSSMINLSGTKYVLYLNTTVLGLLSNLIAYVKTPWPVSSLVLPQLLIFSYVEEGVGRGCVLYSSRFGVDGHIFI